MHRLPSAATESVSAFVSELSVYYVYVYINPKPRRGPLGLTSG